MNVKALLYVGCTFLVLLGTGLVLTGPKASPSYNVAAETLTLPNLAPITTPTNTIVPVIKNVDQNTVVPSVLNNTQTKKVERITLSSSQVVLLGGVISDNAYEVANEIKVKSKDQTDLYLLIDSPGGSVLDGALILSAMEASPARVHTVCVSLCASMAFIIHQHGVTRMAQDRAILMAHPASGGLQGTLEEMNSRLSTIMRYVDKMDARIASRVGMDLPAFKSLIVSEFWVDSEDALQRKFLDKIVDYQIKFESKDMSLFAKFKTRGQFNLKEKFNITW